MTRTNITALAACVAVVAAAGTASAVPPQQPNGTVPSVSGSSVPADSAASAPIQLQAQNGSGETGQATLRQSGADVVVTLKLQGATADAQPAHIHAGTCAKLNPVPKYPLQSITNGTSVTTLKNLSIAQLTAEPYAINVHRSANDLPSYVACGNIAKATGTTGTMMNGSTAGAGATPSAVPSP